MGIKDARPDHPIHAILSRRWSPYAFADRPVTDADLRSLFEAARWAPSSYNEQPWRYLLARRADDGAFARMLSCLVEANQAWARHAPVLALGIARLTFERNGSPNKAAHHDLGLAAGNLCAEATARGLHVHQMIGILPDRVRELYGVPDDAEPLSALAIGYAARPGEAPSALPERVAERDLAPRSRRPLSDFVFAGSFGTPADLGRG